MGNFSKADIITSARSIIGGFPIFTGENSVGDEQLALSLDQAVSTYTQQHPLVKLSSPIELTDSLYYELGVSRASGGPPAILSDWQQSYSHIESIDYDVGEHGRILGNSDEYPNYLVKDQDYLLVGTPSRQYLRFTHNSLDSGKYIEIMYTGTHTLDSDSDGNPVNTIPQHHKTGLEYLTVSKAMMIAGIRSVKSTDPSAGAEFVTFRESKDRGFQRLSERYYDMYLMETGGHEIPAASVGVDAPVFPLVSGVGYYAHKTRRRARDS